MPFYNFFLFCEKVVNKASALLSVDGTRLKKRINPSRVPSCGTRLKKRIDPSRVPSSKASALLTVGGTPLRSLSTTPLREYGLRVGICCPNCGWPCMSRHVTCSFVPTFVHDYHV